MPDINHQLATYKNSHSSCAKVGNARISTVNAGGCWRHQTSNSDSAPFAISVTKKSYGNHANPWLARCVRVLSGGFELWNKSCADNEDMFVVLGATYHDLYDRPEYVPQAIIKLGDSLKINS